MGIFRCVLGYAHIRPYGWPKEHLLFTILGLNSSSVRTSLRTVFIVRFHCVNSLHIGPFTLIGPFESYDSVSLANVSEPRS